MADRVNGYNPRSEPLYLSVDGTSERRDTRIQMPVTGAKYRSGGPCGKSRGVGWAPATPAERGRPGTGQPLGTAELWYPGTTAGAARRGYAPVREVGRIERKKEELYVVQGRIGSPRPPQGSPPPP